MTGIVQSDKNIEAAIINSLIPQISRVFIKAQPEILQGVRSDIIYGLQSTHEYEMLLGNWRGEFGFEKGTEKSRLYSILMTIANSIEIEFKDFNYQAGKITGGLYLYMLIADYSDILSLRSAIVENKGEHPMDIKWLEWLLTKGGLTPSEVAGYRIRFGSEGDRDMKRSRSGIAVMRKNGSWTVPGDGTHNDNWLTRFFTSYDFINEMSDRIETAIMR